MYVYIYSLCLLWKLYLFIYTVLIERVIHNSMCSNALLDIKYILILLLSRKTPKQSFSLCYVYLSLLLLLLLDYIHKYTIFILLVLRKITASVCNISADDSLIKCLVL